MSGQLNSKSGVTRRRFVQAALGLGVTGGLAGRVFDALAAADATITLPFANGERRLVSYPQKRPMILLTARPPQLETPFAVFGEGVMTPNDAFFVRYHLSAIPTSVDAAAHRIKVGGKVNTPLELSLADLQKIADPVDLIAVNQCSGNSRGLFTPRVNGGQLGNGAMGNAKWTGIPLKKILEKAGVQSGAAQVTFDGLDHGPLPATPDFVKSLNLDHAMDGDVMVAYAMNDAPLPMLNGYPVRLVVPGYYGTYWVKHLSDIQVVDQVFKGFWMDPAYRIPDNECNCVPPGAKPEKTTPINRYTVRSFVTSVQDGAQLPAGRETEIKGIAFDGGKGIKEVAFSGDGGRNWQPAKLGKDLGKYAFREWSAPFKPGGKGPVELKCRATNNAGQTQPAEAQWNPAGYLRNVIETVRVTAA